MAINYSVGANIGMAQSVSTSWKTGKKRYVFVDDNTIRRDHVTMGGAIVTQFMSGEKAFQGDLCEFKLSDNTVKILRTFKVVKAVSASDTTILVKRGEFTHKPHAGLNLMKAPSTLSGTGKVGTILSVLSKVDSTLGNVYELTITADALGSLSINDILVEGESVGTSKKMLIQNPNSFLETDLFFHYDAAEDENDTSGAIQMYAPIQHAKCWIERMSPLPECVLGINKSRQDLQFEL